MLTARLSSVSTNLILTSRKALSLALSVWWFGSAWNTGMSIGSAMVGAGTVAYAWGGSKAKEKSKSQKKE
jgi:UDP-xylose/UDP-N-acetylglucosamine transporter B4